MYFVWKYIFLEHKEHFNFILHYRMAMTRHSDISNGLFYLLETVVIDMSHKGTLHDVLGSSTETCEKSPTFVKELWTSHA